MALLRSHSMFWTLGAVCAMVWFVPSPPAISFTQPNHPDRSQTVHHSHQVLANGPGLVCVHHGSSHLPPPSHSLTLTTLTHLRQCIDHIKSLPCINNGLGLVCVHHGLSI